MTNREKKLDFIISVGYAAAITVISAIAIKFLIKPLLPFLIAFAIVSCSRKAVNIIASKTFLSKKASVAIFTSVLIIILALIVYGILYALFGELVSISERLRDQSFSQMLDTSSAKLQEFFIRLKKIPLLGNAAGMINDIILRIDDIAVDALSKAVPSLLAYVIKFISFFPAFLIFTAFLLISLFYIGFDYDKITGFFMLQLSEKTKQSIEETKNIFLSTLRSIFKAYVVLGFITFIQLLCGFAVLKIRYAFILSLLICVVDLFPILGTGTVLLPWSILCFIFSDIKKGVGILVIYAVITIFRQIAEPKIVGANIGLSPLLSLISMYVGLKLAGFLGIILFPIIVITIISLNEKGIIRLYKNPPESNIEKMKKTKHKFLNFKKNDK